MLDCLMLSAVGWVLDWTGWSNSAKELFHHTALQQQTAITAFCVLLYGWVNENFIKTIKICVCGGRVFCGKSSLFCNTTTTITWTKLGLCDLRNLKASVSHKQELYLPCPRVHRHQRLYTNWVCVASCDPSDSYTCTWNKPPETSVNRRRLS